MTNGRQTVVILFPMSEIFDKQQALEQAGGDPALAKDLLGMLFSELPDLLAQLRQAHQERDFKAMWDHAHKIHGSTAYCGVPALKADAQALETLIKEKDETVLPTGIDRVAGQIDSLVQNRDAILAEFD